jgi:microcystin-dependent protein
MRTKFTRLSAQLSTCLLAALPLLGLLAAPLAQAIPYLGEIQCAGTNFVPIGYLPMDGRLLPINQNQALFALIGTFYGGDGVSTFALPDTRGRVIMGVSGSAGYQIGNTGGSETTTVTQANLPQHSHNFAMPAATVAAASGSPAGAVYASRAPTNLYAGGPAGGLQMAQGTTAATGSSIPVDNMKPYLAVTCYIAVEGIFPSPN